MNFLCTIILAFMLFAMGDSICTSLDCIGGNKSACAVVAKRYEAKPVLGAEQ